MEGHSVAQLEVEEIPREKEYIYIEKIVHSQEGKVAMEKYLQVSR